MPIDLLYNNEIAITFDKEHHHYKIDGKRKLGVTTALSVIDKSQGLIPWAVGLALDYVREHKEDENLDSGEIYLKAQQQAEEQKNLAANKGTEIHDWIEAFIKQQPRELPTDNDVLQGIMSFLEWHKKHNVKFLSSERIVYSKQYDYVGTLDFEIEIDGKRYLGDIKTGNALYPEVRLQTAAYLMADYEESGRIYAGRWALRIAKETSVEYYERMSIKNGKRMARGLKPQPIKAYVPFEFIFLDNDPMNLANDFRTFTSCLDLYRWKQEAAKEFK